MACRKCGSDWKTATGRDCQSCPHCNKIQRHLARKAGRWQEVTQQATCKNCGAQFTNVGANAGKTKCCSAKCRDEYRKAWRSAYSAEYKDGLRRGTQASKRLPRPTCKRCGQSFKRKYGGNDANQYCSRKCFYDARNSGDQSWDRTNQIKATWHKCGPYSSAPSVMAMRHIQKCWNHIFKCKNLLPKMIALSASQRMCEVCEAPCNDGASRFCSLACNKAWRGDRQCRCGIVVHNATAFGRAPLCKACKRESLRQQRRLYKDYRRRCRTYGGHYNSSVKPEAVFAKDNWRCHVCGKKTSKVFCLDDPLSATVDHHPIPLSKGGDHDWHNVRCACWQCNTRKGNRWNGQRRFALR